MQVIAGILGCLILLVLGYAAFATAFIYGVLLMIVNAWLLAHRLNQASELSVEAIQRSIYAGAAMRFVILIAGLLLGHLFALHLMVIAAGMFVAQVLVYMIALIDLRKESI
ncbi:MAG: ATP synthase subunit I [Mariprofundus sp.]|nr:ATP synthase subunit I [Mariprofundus sp.]